MSRHDILPSAKIGSMDGRNETLRLEFFSEKGQAFFSRLEGNRRRGECSLFPPLPELSPLERERNALFIFGMDRTQPITVPLGLSTLHSGGS